VGRVPSTKQPEIDKEVGMYISIGAALIIIVLLLILL
jgi:hypothetical protein